MSNWNSNKVSGDKLYGYEWNNLTGYGLVKPASYIIDKSGDTYRALNGTTGKIDYSGTDAASVIQLAINALGTTGGKIFIRAGTYLISSPISISVPLTMEGETGTILKSSGDNSILRINVGFNGLNSAQTIIILNNLAFDGSLISTSTTPIINIENDMNTVSRILRFLNLKFYSGQRGIAYTNQTYKWIAGGSVFQNLQFHNMKASSLCINGAVYDLFLNNIFIYSSDQDPSESYVYLNCIKDGAVENSGFTVQGLTIIGKQGTAITNAMEVQANVVRISNLEIDVVSGNGLFINGTHIYMESFDVTAATGNGISINNSWVSLCNGRITNNQQHGVYVSSGSYLQIFNVNFKDNGQAADSAYDDIHINDNAGANTIISATCSASATNRTRYGLYAGQNSYGIANLETTGLRIGAVYLNVTKLWHLNYLENSKPNKKSGTATIPSGQTSVTVNHGICSTPTVVIVTGSTSDTSDVYVSAVTSTTFTITVPSPVGGDRTVYWYAEYNP